MPRGIKNTPPTPTLVVPAASSPAPLILLQPAPEGTRIDAYALEYAAVIDELRRALIHLVARQSGVTIISELVPRQAAVVAKLAPKPTLASPNGTGPKAKKRQPSDESAGGREWTEMEDIDFQRGGM